MKYILFILVFTISCTKKEKFSQLKIEPTIEPTIIKEQKIEPLVASYDKGLDLILIDTSFDGTISRILANRAEGWRYNAVYWDSNNSQYYP